MSFVAHAIAEDIKKLQSLRGQFLSFADVLEIDGDANPDAIIQLRQAASDLNLTIHTLQHIIDSNLL